MHEGRFKVVFAGHVDHGKSTILGRLLAEASPLGRQKLEDVSKRCRETGKHFEYAFLLDALADERSQGITIDCCRVFFRSSKRDYLVIDAPGHVEFVRNLVTGASHADAAVLVLDAAEGIRENSRRHASLLAMLGVRHIIALVNKMDLVGFSEKAFNGLKEEMGRILSELQLSVRAWIPACGLAGDGVVRGGTAMPWYSGPALLQSLDEIPEPPNDRDKPLRLYIQDVYKFSRLGDLRRIAAGTIDSGTLRPGEKIVLYPSGKQATVKSLEGFPAPPDNIPGAGDAAGFTIEEQIYLRRGELVCSAGGYPPAVSTLLRAAVFWLGSEPLVCGKRYLLRIGPEKVGASLESVEKVIDLEDLTTAACAKQVERYKTAECTLRLGRAAAFDRCSEFGGTSSRFVLLDGGRICGGGIIREAVPDEVEAERLYRRERDSRWIKSFVEDDERAERYGQRAALILITGPREAERKKLAGLLEARLFCEGRIVYFSGIGNIVHGLGADIAGPPAGASREHIRRLGEVANLMLRAGLILIISAIHITENDVQLLSELLPAYPIRSIWLGDDPEQGLWCDLKVSGCRALVETVSEIRDMLTAEGLLIHSA